MHYNYKILLDYFRKFLKNDNVKVNEPMKRHTTFKVGGPCDIMVFPESEQEFINIMKEVFVKKVPYFILGLGSNIIVKDGGIKGVVVNLTKFNNIFISENIIKAEAGARLCDISEVAYENSLTGFEYFCGIPGTIGGSVTMNAGAYGGEISNVIRKVKVMDCEGKIFYVDKEEMEFNYRSALIIRNKYIVLSCDIILNIGDKIKIKEKISDFTFRRNLKQPLEYPSAGSIFKRPQGYFAGKLIEDSGLKGYIYNGAMVSEKHCGFILNRFCAKSSDVLELINIVRCEVYEKFKVNLELEVKIVGED